MPGPVSQNPPQVLDYEAEAVFLERPPVCLVSMQYDNAQSNSAADNSNSAADNTQSNSAADNTQSNSAADNSNSAADNTRPAGLFDNNGPPLPPHAAAAVDNNGPPHHDASRPGEADGGHRHELSGHDVNDDGDDHRVDDSSGDEDAASRYVIDGGFDGGFGGGFHNDSDDGGVRDDQPNDSSSVGQKDPSAKAVHQTPLPGGAAARNATASMGDVLKRGRGWSSAKHAGLGDRKSQRLGEVDVSAQTGPKNWRSGAQTDHNLRADAVHDELDVSAQTGPKNWRSGAQTGHNLRADVVHQTPLPTAAAGGSGATAAARMGDVLKRGREWSSAKHAGLGDRKSQRLGEDEQIEDEQIEDAAVDGSRVRRSVKTVGTQTEDPILPPRSHAEDGAAPTRMEPSAPLCSYAVTESKSFPRKGCMIHAKSILYRTPPCPFGKSPRPPIPPLLTPPSAPPPLLPPTSPPPARIPA